MGRERVHSPSSALMYAGGQGVVFLLQSLARAAIFQLAFCLHIHERARPAGRRDTISFAVSVCASLSFSLVFRERRARASSLFAFCRRSNLPPQCIPSAICTRAKHNVHLSELYTVRAQCCCGCGEYLNSHRRCRVLMRCAANMQRTNARRAVFGLDSGVLSAHTSIIAEI